MSRVLDLLNKFGKVDQYLVVRDIEPPIRVKGKTIPGKTKEFIISASIQPMDSDQVLDESVGSERNKHGIRIYTDEKLNVADERTGFKSDLITFRGEQFEVQKVEDWTQSHLSLKHYKCMAYRVNEIKRKS